MVGAVAVGQADGLVAVVLGVAPGDFFLVHHHHALAIGAKGSLGGVVLVEGSSPLTLEVDGVEQIAHGVLVEFIHGEHLLHHPLGVVAGPLVDEGQRLSVLEVAVLGLSVVEGVGGLHKGGLQLVALALVHKDGAGRLHLRILVQLSTLRAQLLAESVEGVLSGLAEAQRLQYLLLRLTGGADVVHAQGVGHAQRREHHVARAPCQVEELHGKGIVLLHLLALLGRQLNVLRLFLSHSRQRHQGRSQHKQQILFHSFVSYC